LVSAKDPVQELYQVPLAEFVAERKRIAAELKKAGDAAAAKDMLARKRPTMSAWVVNQLYWHARDSFDDLLKTAEKLRKGDLRASADHREAIAKLRKRASTILTEAGHAATEATLRRVTTTLSALAATGGFEPDLPGALAEDRDPPGFEAVGIPSEPFVRSQPEPEPKAHGKSHAKAHPKDELAAARARIAAEQAEKKRAEDEKKRIAIERHRLEVALRTAKSDHRDREHDVKQLEKQLEAAKKAVDKQQALVDDLETKLAELLDTN
jgi:multidrug efflux pump subunit AcrA (membrane-fusion protein)